MFNLTNYSEKIKLELDNSNLDKINSDNLIENLKNSELNYIEFTKKLSIEKDELLKKNYELKKINIDLESKFKFSNKFNEEDHIHYINSDNNNLNNNLNSKEIEFICKFCKNRQNLINPEYPIFNEG
jgi:hypothetical protein